MCTVLLTERNENIDELCFGTIQPLNEKDLSNEIHIPELKTHPVVGVCREKRITDCDDVQYPTHCIEDDT